MRSSQSILALAVAEQERRRRERARERPAVVAPTFRGDAKRLQDWRSDRDGIEVMLSGPSETGKTWATLWYVDWYLRTFAGAQGVMARKLRVTIGPTVLVTYKRVIALKHALGMAPPEPYGGQNVQWYDYPNGSRLWIGGLDDPQKILSGERDIVYINQAEDLAVADWETLTTRTTGRGSVAPWTVLVGDCNPGAADHWILRRAKTGALKLLVTSHRDNPALYDEHGRLTPQGERSMAVLDALTGLRRARLRDGRWVGAEGQYFEHWDEAVHVALVPLPVPADWLLWGALDYGYGHPFAFGVLARDPANHAYILGETGGSKYLIPDQARLMRELCDALQLRPERLRKVVAGHDVMRTLGGTDDRKIVQLFAEEGWRLELAKVDRVAGAQQLAQRLGRPAETAPDGRAVAAIAPSLTVDPRCVRVRTQIPAMVADPAQPEAVRKVDVDPNDGSGGDDFFDMVRYGLMEAPMSLHIPLPRSVLAGAGVKGWSPGRKR